MREYRVKCQNIIISIFLGGNKGNIIYASGLPQYLDKNHPLVQQALRLGYNLFIPKYPGSYESSGFLNIEGVRVDNIKHKPEDIKYVYEGHEVAAHTVHHLTVLYIFR